MPYDSIRERPSELQSVSYAPFSRHRWIIIVLLSLLLTAPIGLLGYGHDFCPVYEGSRLVRDNQSPYGSVSTNYLADTCAAVVTGAGTAYPLPFYFVLLPFTFLSFPIAAIVWTWLGTTLSASIFLFAKQWPRILLLCICFLPFYRAVAIGQSTLLWFGVTALLLLSIYFRWWVSIGLCITLLVLKPQTGILFAFTGLWWGMRYDRRAVVLAELSILILLIIAYVYQPNWLAEWLLQVRVYQTVTSAPSLFYLLPIALLVSWRFPLIAKIALAQVLLFPLTDPYSALPLLVVWIIIGGWMALIGTSISYLWPIWPWNGHWFLIIGPLLLALAYTSWKRKAILADEHNFMPRLY